MFSSDVKRTYLFGARLLMGLVLVAGIAIGSPAAFAAQAPDAPAAASDSKAPDAKTNDKPAEAKPADTKPAGVPAATKAEPAKKVEAKSDDKPAPKQEPPKTEPQDKKGDAKGPEALPGELAEREPSDVDIRAVSKLSAKQKFERLDKKPRDEKLNEREYKAGREEDDALTPNAEFVALDRDADGSLSEEEFTSGFTNYWLLGLIVLAALVLPVGAGHWISKQLRMPDLGMRLAIILTVATVGTVIVVMDRMKLGIDLQGGVILIYEVDQGKTKQLMGDRDNFGSQSDYMDRLVGALNLRLNPGGQKELVIRKYGTNQVEIIVPEATPAEIASTMRRVSKAGFLEFRITANTRNLAKHLDLDAATAIKRVKANKGDVRIDAQRRILDDNQPGGMAFARWIEVDTVKMSDLVEDAQRADGLILRQNDKTEQIEALVILGKPIAESDTTYRLREDVVRGSDLAWASQDYDDQARICVGFSMTTRGANAMGRLTGENLPHDENYHYRLGIVFDGVLISAPNIQSTISERGIITGRFTEKEVSETVSVLNAGSLPAVLNEQPVSQYEISPTLGSDTIRQSTIAMYASTACILLFMVLYYRFSGVVACIALLMNLLITVAAMMFVDAALTLPGMAGLALTIGMAVDASVLIFERMREEQERGAAMRMVIRNGFDKAMTTIIDSNLTTVIVAFVLYAIGTDQIKGFAVTLMIGLLANLFTAITVSRVIFDIAERKRWLRQLSMGKLLGETHIDFVGKQRLAIGASVVLILVGLVAVAMRGGTLLDIDFAGGTSVQVALTEPMEVADVRSAVDAELPDVTVSEVHAANVTDGTRFKIDTSLGNPTSIDLEFDRRDADNDGRLDLAEYVDDRQGRIAEFAKKRFEELDNKNKKKDGYLVGVAAADGEFTITKDDVENYWLDKVFGDQLQRNRLAYRELKPLGAAKEPNAKKTDAEKTEVEKKDTPAETASASQTEVVLEFAQPLSHDEVKLSLETVAAVIQEGLGKPRIELANKEHVSGNKPYETWTLRITRDPQQTKQLLDEFKQQLASKPVFPTSSTIGGQVAARSQQYAVFAIVVSLIAIIIYVWIRFQKVVYGAAAVVALVHDVLVTLGMVAISAYIVEWAGWTSPVLLMEPFKINLPVVAAFLTIIGFSINDTIVIFDRIRDLRGKSPYLTAGVINASVNQMLGRTLLTSMTVITVVTILYIWGGAEIHGFAFAMLVGLVAGVYSTVYVATPIVLWMTKAPEPPRGGPPRPVERTPVEVA